MMARNTISDHCWGQMQSMGINMYLAASSSRIILVYQIPITLTTSTTQVTGQLAQLRHLDSIMCSRPLLQSATTHNGEDIMKPWDKKTTTSISMVRLSRKAYRARMGFKMVL